MTKSNNISIKNRKDKIISLLKNKPLAPTQILILEKENRYPLEKDWIINKKDARRKYERELRNLSKSYLIPMVDEKRIFALNSSDRIKYGEIGLKRTEYLSAKNFIKKYWYKKEGWGKTRGNKNYFHVYYFSTPVTYKWKIIFEEVIEEDIIKRFSEYLQNKEEIKKTISELWDVCQRIETFPKYKIKKSRKGDVEEDWLKDFKELVEYSKNLNFRKRKVTKKELIESKGHLFGFDVLAKDFQQYLYESSELGYHYGHLLNIYLERLHKLLLFQEIKISNVLAKKFSSKKLLLR